MTDRQRAALLRAALKDFRQTREGYTTHPNGPHWQAGMEKCNRLLKDLQPPPIPQLGPVLEDGLAMLLQAPTHNTDGVPGYPAYDTGFGQAGRWIIAPEKLVITKQSGAVGGDAVYATGASKIKYWIGHLTPAPATGRTFLKGARIARIANQAATDHVHWGLDVRPLTGKTLLYGATGHGPDYSYGSPTIGAQLATMLSDL